MITILTAPPLNKILLDSNNTIVSLTSTNGAGYFFRAKIYIDDALFDTQSWSRSDAFTTIKDLKKLYNAYFETVFNTTFANGLNEQTHLKKKVSIIVEERLLSTDALIASVSLPDYYIIYNTTPVSFSDEAVVEFLGVDASKIIIPANGKISIPIYTNTTAEEITVTLTDNFNTVLDTITIASGTAKKVFLYNFDLSALTLVNNTIYFTLSVQVGATTITKSFRYLEYPDFTPKEIAFQNNFGFYLFAYLDGQMNIDNALDINSFEQKDGTEKIYEINEELTYNINSGSLLSSEKQIINQITTALDAKLYFNNEWLDLVTKTKKSKIYQERLNNYSENLVFSVRKNYSVANNFETPIVEDPIITLTDVTGTDGSNYEVDFELNFAPIQLFYQTRTGLTWSDGVELPQTIPQTITPELLGAAFDIRLFAVYNEATIYSGIIAVDEIIIPAIAITDVTSADGDTYEVAFTENFTPPTIYVEYYDGDSWSAPEALAGTTSPQDITPGLSGASFIFRLSGLDGATTIYSNEQSVDDFLIPELTFTDLTSADDENFEMSFAYNWLPDTVSAQMKVGSTWDTAIPFAGNTSPQSLNFSTYIFPFRVRLLAVYEGETIYSNELTYGTP